MMPRVSAPSSFMRMIASCTRDTLPGELLTVMTSGSLGAPPALGRIEAGHIHRRQDFDGHFGQLLKGLLDCHCAAAIESPQPVMMMCCRERSPGRTVLPGSEAPSGHTAG